MLAPSLPARQTLLALLAGLIVSTLALCAPAGAQARDWAAKFKGAPAWHEITPATGWSRTRKPKAVILTIHGGGWFMVGAQYASVERPEATLWQHRGFMTINVAYRADALSVPDVLWFYDHARKRFGKAMPICATGGSAGGQLALMIAAERPDLACAVNLAGPTDLTALARETARNRDTGGQTTAGALTTLKMAVNAFGIPGLAENSPSTFESQIHTPILAAISSWDFLVPQTQITQDFHPAGPYRAVVLDGTDSEHGGQTFVHTPVTAASLENYRSIEARFAHSILRKASAARAAAANKR